MEHRESDPPRFDERAALEKLERLRQDIERYRLKRKAVSEEFEAFVRSFKTPQPAAGKQPDHAKRGTPPPAAVPSAAPPAYDAAVPLAPIPAAAPAHPGARVRTPAIVGGALLLAAAGGWITWMVRARAPERSAAAPLPDARAAAPSASPPPTQSANQPAAPVSELTTTRRVWVRVIADGQRIVEGELPANARVPLTAEKTVVIRTGNAGVVRLTLRGQDQGALGPEGTVVTRTFTVPPRAAR